ncbi:hypothetical protein Bca52824_015941 [Brassica carinata]|uniref:Uncharacterized protein n=1 Tax=Brassica carinata TaxID=52824 RepID=A0A8X7W2R7_BRACI|nr:hypothetical protein Bca52824_015941 [Brassica carinata]
MVCIVAAKAAVLSPSPRCLGKGGGSWQFLRRGVSVGASMALTRRCCDLPPSGCSLPGSCFKNRLLKFHDRLPWFPKAAIGDDARGSVWSADLVGIIGGSIRCRTSGVVASTWLLRGSVVALMLLCRSSSSSGSRSGQLVPSSCLPLLAGRSSYL